MKLQQGGKPVSDFPLQTAAINHNQIQFQCAAEHLSFLRFSLFTILSYLLKQNRIYFLVRKGEIF